MATKPLQSITFPGLPDTYTVPSKAEDVGAASLEYARQIGNPRNLLDNSNFMNPVNQRGLTSYTDKANKYTIDRWYTYGTVTINDRCIEFTDVSTNGNQNLYQYLPVGTIKPNVTYTMACQFEDGTISLGITSVTDGNYKAVQVADDGKFRLRIGANISGKDQFAICIFGNEGGSYRIKWVALYEGEYTRDTLPPYIPKGYAAELLECQRYFINLGNSSFGFGFVSANGTSCGIIIPMPTKMRATPTVTVDNFRIKYRTLQKSVSNFAVTKINSSSILLTVTETFTVDSSGSGAPAIAFSNGMTLSADL